ncbi:SSSCA1 [Branchiostoma lanceolatum]|uniref:SSSCA1 protein n=2 Tax=Branchiostoma lanceolatum TaxID=7740 RepID=A0A8K0EUN8_BRALA|nr:SSSCA1 [Branchiostoma lanceolatum]
MNSHDMDPDDYDWQPPTEADLKVIEARRERNDQISKRMGDYLLKGWKMLGTNCEDCGCILLRDKQGADYCVACNELESDHDKDNPAVNEEAARGLHREAQYATAAKDLASSSVQEPDINHVASPPRNITQQEDTVPRNRLTSANPIAVVSSAPQQVSSASQSHAYSQAGEWEELAEVAGMSVEAVQKKLVWATEELGKTSSIENSIQLCMLIKACAEALVALKKV